MWIQKAPPILAGLLFCFTKWYERLVSKGYFQALPIKLEPDPQMPNSVTTRGTVEKDFLAGPESQRTLFDHQVQY